MNGSDLGKGIADGLIFGFVIFLFIGIGIGAIIFNLIPYLWTHIHFSWGG